MSYDSFYRYIKKEHGKYWIIKNSERYLDCNTLAEALYERDRFEHSDWNWDNYVQLPETINGYIHIDLPLFEHKPKYVYLEKERWVVIGKGRRQKYYGTYYSLEEAENVARIYNANIAHKKGAYFIKRKINGEMKFFGRYHTEKEALERLEELDKNGWKQ